MPRNDCNPVDRCNQRIYPEIKELEAQDGRWSIKYLSEAAWVGSQPINPKLILNINAHLTTLKDEIEQYFPNLELASLKLLINSFQAQEEGIKNH